ncbi:response regulator transcription factor [Microbacterium sp. HD4P20]|uniref:response regulator n=1 Tax=Microbacterium sp. HD4P20 TaxID=2864874 RepID=UPI0020A5CBCA|nr:response regulator transcription factor [Microbacterium sp. HD4P20]MCP2635517.1 response regulator transcription factor [Microbacterium sp. HD4P20]
MSRPIRVLLADDQELLRDALATVLGAESDIEVVATVADGAAAVAAVRTHRIDVVLMDIRMPGMDGIRATGEVLRASPRTRVLVLTTFDIDEYVFAAVQAGASGFLTKDARPVALADAIRSVAAGDAAVSPRATATLLGHVRRRASAASGRAALEALSPRERDVMRHLARGASNAEIGRGLHLTENTVKTHVKAILAKLGLADRIQVVIWAYEHGIVEPGSHPAG